jgi:hypothetical protein
VKEYNRKKLEQEKQAAPQAKTVRTRQNAAAHATPAGSSN